MEIKQTPEPIAVATSLLQEEIAHSGGINLCFLAGGSALDILPAIHLTSEQKRRTIFVMGDERWSREKSEVNFLLLMERLESRAQEFQVVDTSPRPQEEFEQFVKRINRELKKIFSMHEHFQQLAILGIGEDGHTASIFPMAENRFQETYEADSTYVSVHVEGLTSEYRASLSPGYILDEVDVVIGFAAGSGKKEVLEKLIREDLELNEMPSQIIKRHKHSFLVTDQEVI